MGQRPPKDPEREATASWSRRRALQALGVLTGGAAASTLPREARGAVQSEVRWLYADTIAELEREESAVAQGARGALLAVVAGYHHPFDGGGGVLRWSADSRAERDGGLCFAPPSRRQGQGQPGRWHRLSLAHAGRLPSAEGMVEASLAGGRVDARHFGVLVERPVDEQGRSALLGEHAIYRLARLRRATSADLAVGRRNWEALHRLLRSLRAGAGGALSDGAVLYLPSGLTRVAPPEGEEHGILLLNQQVDVAGDGVQSALLYYGAGAALARVGCYFPGAVRDLALVHMTPELPADGLRVACSANVVLENLFVLGFSEGRRRAPLRGAPGAGPSSRGAGLRLGDGLDPRWLADPRWPRDERTGRSYDEALVQDLAVRDVECNGCAVGLYVDGLNQAVFSNLRSNQCLRAGALFRSGTVLEWSGGLVQGMGAPPGPSASSYSERESLEAGVFGLELAPSGVGVLSALRFSGLYFENSCTADVRISPPAGLWNEQGLPVGASGALEVTFEGCRFGGAATTARRSTVEALCCPSLTLQGNSFPLPLQPGYVPVRAFRSGLTLGADGLGALGPDALELDRHGGRTYEGLSQVHRWEGVVARAPGGAARVHSELHALSLRAGLRDGAGAQAGGAVVPARHRELRVALEHPVPDARPERLVLVLTASWGATCGYDFDYAQGGGALRGFRARFSSPAPASGGHCSWLLVVRA